MAKKSEVPEFEPIKPTRAHEAILAQLQRRILEGDLAPGARLPSEREMMETFGVSRPTIREALRVAESLGLIAVRHGDPGGPRVLARPSLGVVRVLDSLLGAERTSLAELIEARIVLEGTAARLAASAPVGDLGPLEEAFRSMETAPDAARFVEADALFHRRVAEVGGNRLLVLFLSALHDPIVRLISTGLARETGSQAREAILLAHAGILKAIRDRDGVSADRLSRRHLIDLYADLVPAEARERLGSLSG
ncbi:FadR/GntR family transcriptional regulator [Singulisphaera sp. PoT]|uniref:FadR/GntR family transcriptional regulator n=1 Tax=Singulisphaera sp. PoT TaxID=3411797 RepID=UPI003BF481DD